MTNKDYDHVRELLSNQQIVLFAKQFCETNDIDPIQDYPKTSTSIVMKTAARRQMYLAKAIDLLRRVIFLNGTKNELIRAAVYVIVIIHSMDKSLDYRECGSLMRIQELENRYSLGEVLTSGLEPESILETVRRTNEFYGVNIQCGS